MHAFSNETPGINFSPPMVRHRTFSIARRFYTAYLWTDAYNAKE
jgi:hypothetical protein